MTAKMGISAMLFTCLKELTRKASSMCDANGPRERASGKFGLVQMQVPDDFTPHRWGPACVPESSDTLEEVHAHLDQLVEEGILTAEERACSEGSCKRLFQVKTL
jgi:hypothetical protein